MKRITFSLIFIFAFGFGFSQSQAFYNVTAGTGNGIRFWWGSTDEFKMHMGNTAEDKYGPVTWQNKN